MTLDTRQRRNIRLKSIIEFLSEEHQPRTFSEIMNHVRKKWKKITERNIHYDLILLGSVDRIVSNTPSKGLYSIKGPIILSQGDYDLARRHNEVLLVSTEERQCLDCMNDKTWLNALPTYQGGFLLDHLKSGYYREFWLPYREYIELNESEKVTRLKKEQAERKESLSKELITKLRTIMDRFNHGALLDGHCSNCPTSYVRIKGVPMTSA